jgi:DNA-binding HxlR family transcriptional regulator
MKSYGQFCSIAKALEVAGERWTPLILRELICGSTRYSEIQRGVPRISPALLSKRLNDLERCGVIQRARSGGYTLTKAGWELKPVIEQLGVWGQRWVRGQLSEADYDPDLVMWDMRRRLDLTKLPQAQICLRFEFLGQRRNKRYYWLVGGRNGVELCITNPGYPVDLYITTDAQTMTLVWNGDLPLRRMIRDGRIELHGQPALCKAFPGWLQLGMFANVPAAIG